MRTLLALAQGPVANERIVSVTFKLHHTFSPNTARVLHAPFVIRRHGWGEFVVGVAVELVGPDGKTRVHECDHDLKLDKEVATTVYKVTTVPPPRGRHVEWTSPLPARLTRWSSPQRGRRHDDVVCVHVDSINRVVTEGKAPPITLLDVFTKDLLSARASLAPAYDGAGAAAPAPAAAVRAPAVMGGIRGGYGSDGGGAAAAGARGGGSGYGGSGGGGGGARWAGKGRHDDEAADGAAPVSTVRKSSKREDDYPSWSRSRSVPAAVLQPPAWVIRGSGPGAPPTAVAAAQREEHDESRPGGLASSTSPMSSQDGRFPFIQSDQPADGGGGAMAVGEPPAYADIPFGGVSPSAVGSLLRFSAKGVSPPGGLGADPDSGLASVRQGVSAAHDDDDQIEACMADDLSSVVMALDEATSAPSPPERMEATCGEGVAVDAITAATPVATSTTTTTTVSMSMSVDSPAEAMSVEAAAIADVEFAMASAALGSPSPLPRENAPVAVDAAAADGDADGEYASNQNDDLCRLPEEAIVSTVRMIG